MTLCLCESGLIRYTTRDIGCMGCIFEEVEHFFSTVIPLIRLSLRRLVEACQVGSL